MNRQEHLDWCKQRALEYCDSDDVNNAWASMVSDLSKHDETRNHTAIDLGNMQLVNGMLSTPADMRRFIEGFN